MYFELLIRQLEEKTLVGRQWWSPKEYSYHKKTLNGVKNVKVRVKRALLLPSHHRV